MVGRRVGPRPTLVRPLALFGVRPIKLSSTPRLQPRQLQPEVREFPVVPETHIGMNSPIRASTQAGSARIVGKSITILICAQRLEFAAFYGKNLRDDALGQQ
jgi:hypothetical protein